MRWDQPSSLAKAMPMQPTERMGGLPADTERLEHLRDHAIENAVELEVRNRLARLANDSLIGLHRHTETSMRDFIRFGADQLNDVWQSGSQDKWSLQLEDEVRETEKGMMTDAVYELKVSLNAVNRVTGSRMVDVLNRDLLPPERKQAVEAPKKRGFFG